MTRLRARSAFALVMLGLMAGPAFAEDPQEALAMMARREAAAPKDQVVTLRGVDKITAQVTDIKAPMNQPLRFGSLEITPRTCSKRPPEETPEVTAFLEIADVKPDGEKQKLFSGWMFASSPALSALEHPVYDVWVIDCNAIAPGM
ncbi:DUF2155 domain-containing protein [Emcibacter sp. SYSU 3D8]|uniref:DUF2155 domain-containing protein n=1 Tax=Emcibacter sp. SYSU 3D8 TaxID=3133969 RepID=UPI0031FEBBCF